MTFVEFKERGLESVGIVVSDSLAAIDRSIASQLGCAHQKCTVHLQRNLMGHVRASDFWRLLNVDDQAYGIGDALLHFTAFKEKWSSQYSAFGRYLDNLELQPHLTRATAFKTPKVCPCNLGSNAAFMRFALLLVFGVASSASNVRDIFSRILKFSAEFPVLFLELSSPNTTSRVQ